MRKLSGFVLAALVVLMCGAVVFAQGAGPRGGRGARGPGGGAALMTPGVQWQAIADILKQVKLTDEQQQKIDQIKADFDKKIVAAREKSQAAGEEVRTLRNVDPVDKDALAKAQEEAQKAGGAMRDLTTGLIEEIKGVLNEEQLKQFNELYAARAPQAGRMGGGPMGQGQGVPGLNPRLMDGLNLTDEQKEKAKAIGQKFADEQIKLIEKYQAIVKEILTPEQQEKFTKAVEDMKTRMQQRQDRRGGAQGGPNGGGAGVQPPPQDKPADKPAEAPPAK
jgi:Spy/CpxP family protein refolding chaperone